MMLRQARLDQPGADVAQPETTVSLKGRRDVPVRARVADADYVATSGTLSFGPDELTKTVTVTINRLEFGQGVMVAAALARTGARCEVSSIGLKEVPACGSNADVLAYHGLDAAGIARAVVERSTVNAQR